MTKLRAYFLMFGGIGWLVAVPFVAGILEDLGVADTGKSLPFFLVWAIGASVFWVAGGAVWAGAKGHDPLLGAGLVFFLSLLGLQIIVLLPDKSFSNVKWVEPRIGRLLMDYRYRRRCCPS